MIGMGMWEYLLLSAVTGFAAFKLSLILYRRRKYPEPHYDWNEIDTDSLSFPDGFYWGSATAAHQVEGNLTNNWTEHEAVSYTHLRAHETREDLVCRLLLEKKK